MIQPSRAGILSAALAILSMATPVTGQGIWPDEPANLQALPEGTTSDELRDIMRGWTGALGVRCSYCHVGEEGAPLSSYDFASDDNPMKDRTRTMIRMLRDVRAQLETLQPSGAPVAMTCATCHAGRARPQTLQEAVSERQAAQGPDAVVPFYLELRERHYGGPAFDFRPGAVDALAVAVHQSGAVDAGFALLELNAGHHPEWAGTWATMGRLAADAGELDRARTFYRRALSIEPENSAVQRALEALGGR